MTSNLVPYRKLIAAIALATLGAGYTESVHADATATMLAEPFEAGATHADGRYAFTNDNFLIEGAQKVKALGINSIFLYFTPGYASHYPVKSGVGFGNPTNLTQLAQSAPYKKVFDMPFQMIVLSTFGFATGDGGYGHFATANNSMAARETAEISDVVRYLETTYKGTGKTFVLKTWEGDWATQATINGTYGDPNASDPAQGLTEMTRLLSAREQGCMNGRAAAGNPEGVAVFCAGEVNFVMDWQTHARVIQNVIPNVNPPLDMVTYSSYETSNWLYGTSGTNASQTSPIIKTELTKALDVINQFAKDPMHLGKKRILISEYGMFENSRPAGEAAWRTRVILQTAKDYGTAGAFFWQVFDNECANFKNEVGANPGQYRPGGSDCLGLWLVRPDGSTSGAVPVLQSFNSGAVSPSSSPSQSQSPPPSPSQSPSLTVTTPTANSSVGNNVTITSTYSGPTALGHFEVWVNGIKKSNTSGSANFSGSNKLSGSFSLPSGNDQLTVIAVGANGAVIVKSATQAFHVN